MTCSNISVPLDVEFENIIHLMQSEHKCMGKSRRLPRCGNKIDKKAWERAVQLLQEVAHEIQCEEAVDEELLRHFSSLVMCSRHKGQAAAKFEEWCERIKMLDLEDKPREVISEAPDPVSNVEILDNFKSLKISDDGAHTRPTTPVEFKQSEACSTSKALGVSLKNDFEDSAICLDNGDGSVEAKHGESLPPPSSGSPSTPLRTPKRPVMPVKVDSAISMSNGEAVTGVDDEGCPESPTAAKAQRSTHQPAVRAASAPLLPRGTSLEPEFTPFNDPLKKLKQYIKTDLPPSHTLEGYIYCFQVEGTNKNKIGSALPRYRKQNGERVPIPLEKSFVMRMNQHKLERGTAPKVLLKIKVPYARRIEKIIHYHLEPGRMRESPSAVRQAKSKKKIPVHLEFFNNSFAEISKVMKAWGYWSSMMPYEETMKNGNPVHCLTAHWEECLQGLKAQPFRNNWLDWLYKNVPEVERQLPLSAKELIEKERSVDRSALRRSESSQI